MAVVTIIKKRSNYIKKPKVNYSVDLSIYNYLVSGIPLPINVFPKTSQEIASFVSVVNAVDKRKELLAMSKGRKAPANTLSELSERCLTVATNKDVPSMTIVNSIYASFLEGNIPDNVFVNKINNARRHVKDVLGESNYNNSNYTKDDYALLYIDSYKRNNMWLSLDDELISIYQKVVDYWNTSTQVINGKSLSWDDIYNNYYNKGTKPNSIRFINQFCNNYGVPRGTAQILLIVYNSPSCFTADDVAVISQGSDFFSILNKIQYLTKKSI